MSGWLIFPAVAFLAYFYFLVQQDKSGALWTAWQFLCSIGALAAVGVVIVWVVHVAHA